jgi:hypothetical protein
MTTESQPTPNTVIKPKVNVGELVDLYTALRVYATYNDKCWLFDLFEVFDPRVAEMHFENLLLLLSEYRGRPWELYPILRRYVEYARQVYGAMSFSAPVVKVIKTEVDKAIEWYIDYLRRKDLPEAVIEEEVKEMAERLTEQKVKFFRLLDCGLPCGRELSAFQSLEIHFREFEAEEKSGKECHWWWEYPRPKFGIIPWKTVDLEELIGKLQEEEAAQR